MTFADLHCDTIHRLHFGGSYGDLAKNDGHVDLERLLAGAYALQVFAAFVKLDAVKDPMDTCLALLDELDIQLEPHQTAVTRVLQAQDMEKPGLKALYSVEEGGVLGTDEQNLELLYGRGVRALTLTWNFPNALGYPNAEFTHANRGLTPFGKRIVEKMKDMGMVTDVSHLSDQGFWDVADILKGPFMASHSNARAMHHHPRNLTDSQIRAVAELGGVVGLNFCAWFLDGTEHMTLEAFLRHFGHVYRIGGAEVLALGTDFDGITNTVELEGCQNMHKLEAALRQAGYSPSVIEKAMYQNALRLFRDALK